MGGAMTCHGCPSWTRLHNLTRRTSPLVVPNALNRDPRVLCLKAPPSRRGPCSVTGPAQGGLSNAMDKKSDHRALTAAESTPTWTDGHAAGPETTDPQ